MLLLLVYLFLPTLASITKAQTLLEPLEDSLPYSGDGIEPALNEPSQNELDEPLPSDIENLESMRFMEKDIADQACYRWYNIPSSSSSSPSLTPAPRDSQISFLDITHRYLYIIGGCGFASLDNPSTCFPTFYQFDLLTQSWSTQSLQGIDDHNQNIVLKMHGQAWTVDPTTGSVFIFGGSRVSTRNSAHSAYSTFSDSLDVIVPDCTQDPCIYTWIHKVPQNSPPQREDSALVFHQSLLIVFGGYSDAGFYSDLWMLDTTQPRWNWISVQTENAPPAARRGHTFTKVGDRLFLFGGSDGNTTFNDVYELQWNKKHPKPSWVLLQTSSAGLTAPPAPRAFHTATGVDDRLIIFGGCDFQFSQCYNDIHILDTQTLVWQSSPSYLQLLGPGTPSLRGVQRPEGRSRHSAVLFTPPAQESESVWSDGLDEFETPSIFVFGGCDFEACYNNIFQLDVVASCEGRCGDHGRHNPQTQHCECLGDYQGKFCLRPGYCPNNCSYPLGTCVEDEEYHYCQCVHPYWGSDCGSGPCPSNCSGAGLCQEHSGGVPTISTVAVQATTKGKKHNKKHQEEPKLPPPQATAVCECVPGFSGQDCSTPPPRAILLSCPRNCSGHGICRVNTEAPKSDASSSAPVCMCLDGFTGEDCNTACPALCSGPSQGTCLAGGVCKCKPGYKGLTCSTTYCHNNCNGVGTCVLNQCQCPQGTAGAYCQIDTSCSGHGAFRDGVCQCDDSFTGDSCEFNYVCESGCVPPFGQCVYVAPKPEANENSGGEQQLTMTTKTLTSTTTTATTITTTASGVTTPTKSKTNGGALIDLLLEETGDAPNKEVSSLATTAAAAATGATTTTAATTAAAAAAAAAAASRSAPKQVQGVCRCAPGFTGPTCLQALCPKDCSAHGICLPSGMCQCYPGYSGVDCGTGVTCPSNCTAPSHGKCQSDGTCECAPNFSGKDCAQLRCPSDCNQRGECVEGKCKCGDGFSGADCGIECLKQCSNNGVCIGGACVCRPDWTGEDCATAKQCPIPEGYTLPCGGPTRGRCYQPEQRCYCRPGYYGTDCALGDGGCGLEDCNRHGVCVDGACICDLGYEGEHCQNTSVCSATPIHLLPEPADPPCSHHGFCHTGQCHCCPGFGGPTCKEVVHETTCPNNCSGNGVCQFGRCYCVSGHTGRDCSESVGFCHSQTCNGRGECRFGKCFCEPGYSGDTCEKGGCEMECPKEKGQCANGKCHCLPGWTGVSCTEPLSCPGGPGLRSCSGNGVCILGVCECMPGWAGSDCSVVTIKPHLCPNNCSSAGYCHIDRCYCAPGYTGPDCSIVVEAACPWACSGRGICNRGKCYCDPGYEGLSCQQESRCPNSCSSHGVCEYGICYCFSGWTGESCSEQLSDYERIKKLEEDLDLASRAYERARAASGDFPAGSIIDCSSLRSCSNHGICILGSDGYPQCACETGYGGRDCGQLIIGALARLCPDSCSNHGECLFGKCICQPGYTGVSCSEVLPLSCPKDCSGKGVCFLGRCICAPDWSGPTCQQRSACPVDCGQFGVCISSKCQCVKGYRGDDCSKSDGTAARQAFTEIEDTTLYDDSDTEAEELSPSSSSSSSSSVSPLLLEENPSLTTPTAPTTDTATDDIQPNPLSSSDDEASPSSLSESSNTLLCPAECLTRSHDRNSISSSSQLSSQLLEVPTDSHSQSRSVPTYTVALGGFVAGAFVSLLFRWVLDKRQQLRTRAIMTSLTERP